MYEKFPWSTHQELLVACVCASSGMVLELGCGHYSTPILHHICKASHRRLLTCDHNLKWMDQFRYLENDSHIFIVHNGGIVDGRIVSQWETFRPIDEQRLGCALIDHDPGTRFAPDIQRLRSHTEFIVAHDAEPAKNLGVIEIAKTFKYSYIDQRHSVWTAAMSDFSEIPI